MADSWMIAETLGLSISQGELTESDVADSAQRVLGRRYAFVKGLAGRMVAEFGEGTRPRSARLTQFIYQDSGFLRATRALKFSRLSPQETMPRMLPARGAPTRWVLPALLGVGEVADWLGLEWNQLLWLADARSMEARAPEGPLRHYRRRWIRKRDGGARLLESPKLRLKTIQRKILSEILNPIPPHDSAHGFRKGRSIVSFAVAHTGKAMVLRMDLRDFFPSISRARITALLMTAGYPEPVSELLANLCCTVTPPDVLSRCPATCSLGLRWALRKIHQRPHLPQGAPTSPALANLCAFGLDCRLTALAKACGAVYTRYADDLLFSGGDDFVRCAKRVEVHAAAIAMDEGFHVHTRKTRFMRASARQHAAGIVLNSHANVPRHDFDAIKAILNNCIKHGPADQNRDNKPDFRSHLAGRIAHVAMVNPVRGRRLRAMFDRIDWSS